MTMVLSTHPRNLSHSRNSGNSNTTTSPLYPQANGIIEKSVQTVKNLLPKAKQGNRDPCLGLLEYKNTPLDEVALPAQLLMSRLGPIISTIEVATQSP